MLVPLPFEAKLSLPGLRRACSRSSRTLLTGVFAETTSTFRAAAHERDRGEVLLRVEGQRLVERHVDRVGRRSDEERVAVGALFATKSVPMLPPEPVRFSTITGWPSASPRRGASARAVKSVIPPGER